MIFFLRIMSSRGQGRIQHFSRGGIFVWARSAHGKIYAPSAPHVPWAGGVCARKAQFFMVPLKLSNFQAILAIFSLELQDRGAWRTPLKSAPEGGPGGRGKGKEGLTFSNLPGIENCRLLQSILIISWNWRRRCWYIFSTCSTFLIY